MFPIAEYGEGVKTRLPRSVPQRGPATRAFGRRDHELRRF